MATKKAKPKSKAKAKTKTKTVKTLVNKKTTTRVVKAKVAKKAKKPTTKVVASKASGNVLIRFGRFLVQPSTIRMIVLELLGTFVLASIFLTLQGHPMYMMFAVVGVYLLLGNKTDGFFNPALSFGAWISRKLDGMKTIAQIVAQILGGMLSLVTFQTFLKGATEAADLVSGGSQGPQLFTLQALPAGKEWFVFAAEIIGMLIIGLFLARALASRRSVVEKAIGMGMAIFVGAVVASSAASFIEGVTVLNPAFLTTLQAFSGEGIKETWAWIVSVYIVAPLIGGVIGFTLGNLLTDKSEK